MIIIMQKRNFAGTMPGKSTKGNLIVRWIARDLAARCCHFELNDL